MLCNAVLIYDILEETRMKLIVINGRDVSTDFRVSKMCRGHACEFSTNFDIAEFDINCKKEKGHTEYYVFVNSRMPVKVVESELKRRCGL